MRVLFWAPLVLKALIMHGDRRKTVPGERSLRQTTSRFAHGVLRRGHKLYNRHSIFRLMLNACCTRLPVDATLLQPLNDNRGARFLEIAPSPPASIQPGDDLMSGEAYCSYIDDTTRAWPANTREASETGRELTIAVIGQATPVLSSHERIAMTCRTFFDSFLPTRPSPSEAVAPARQRSEHSWAAGSRSSARRTPTRVCRTGTAF